LPQHITSQTGGPGERRPASIDPYRRLMRRAIFRGNIEVAEEMLRVARFGAHPHTQVALHHDQ
jgi:hypothetical protein